MSKTATNPAQTRQQIARWMRAHKAEHVEAWDRACADGGATLDRDHIAWDIAVEVAS